MTTDPRIIPCKHCGSEGRIYRGKYEDERDCGPCPVCEGTGGEIVETEAVERCPDCGLVEPLLYPCFASECPLRARAALEPKP
jgi:hypothetical protein